MRFFDSSTPRTEVSLVQPATPTRQQRSWALQLDRVVGQLLLVLLLELGLIWAFDSTSSWAELEVLAVGALGVPWTLAAPWLLVNDHDAAALAVLVAAPILNLAIRYWVAWNRLDDYEP